MPTETHNLGQPGLQAVLLVKHRQIQLSQHLHLINAEQQEVSALSSMIMLSQVLYQQPQLLALLYVSTGFTAILLTWAGSSVLADVSQQISS